MRGETLGQRPGPVAASGVGSARDQSTRDRVSAASADVPRLWRNDLCGVASGRAAGPVGTAFDGFRRASMAYYRQSKRRTAEFLGMLLGQPCCPALTVKIQNQVTAALRPSYEQAAAALPAEPQSNIDETATKEENGKAWLWTFVAHTFTVFAVRATREATALAQFLGEAFHGVVTCDRAKMYWRLGRLQWCWAHLKRDFQGMIDSVDKRAKWLAERLRAATCELFEHWADYRAGTISWAALVRRMGPFRWRRNACCCAARNAATPTPRHVPGVVRASPVVVERSCATKGSNRRTMWSSGPCVMR